ncbi:hypothetical protein SNEBB_001988 [Seison nebaliae]|nr:hypothetical protein SNEBB_001988 [Seison nebaliae]
MSKSHNSFDVEIDNELDYLKTLLGKHEPKQEVVTEPEPSIISRIRDVDIEKILCDSPKWTNKSHEKKNTKIPPKSSTASISSISGKYKHKTFLPETNEYINSEYFLKDDLKKTRKSNKKSSFKFLPITHVNETTTKEKEEDKLKKLLLTENNYTLKHSYIQSDKDNIQPYMRRLVTTWMMEVCDEEKCQPQVFLLAVDIFDRYLEKNSQINTDLLQLIGATCMFVASKIKQVIPLKALKLIAYTDNTYKLADILNQELIITNALSWDMISPSIYDFLDSLIFLFLQNVVRKKENRHNILETFNEKTLFPSVEILRQMCVLLATFTKTEITFSSYNPSILAMACIYSCFTSRIPLYAFNLVFPNFFQAFLIKDVEQNQPTATSTPLKKKLNKVQDLRQTKNILKQLNKSCSDFIDNDEYLKEQLIEDENTERINSASSSNPNIRTTTRSGHTTTDNSRLHSALSAVSKYLVDEDSGFSDLSVPSEMSFSFDSHQSHNISNNQSIDTSQSKSSINCMLKRNEKEQLATIFQQLFKERVNINQLLSNSHFHQKYLGYSPSTDNMSDMQLNNDDILLENNQMVFNVNDQSTIKASVHVPISTDNSAISQMYDLEENLNICLQHTLLSNYFDMDLFSNFWGFSSNGHLCKTEEFFTTFLHVDQKLLRSLRSSILQMLCCYLPKKRISYLYNLVKSNVHNNNNNNNNNSQNSFKYNSNVNKIIDNNNNRRKSKTNSIDNNISPLTTRSKSEIKLSTLTSRTTTQLPVTTSKIISPSSSTKKLSVLCELDHITPNQTMKGDHGRISSSSSSSLIKRLPAQPPTTPSTAIIQKCWLNNEKNGGKRPRIESESRPSRKMFLSKQSICHSPKRSINQQSHQIPTNITQQTRRLSNGGTGRGNRYHNDSIVDGREIGKFNKTNHDFDQIDRSYGQLIHYPYQLGSVWQKTKHQHYSPSKMFNESSVLLEFKNGDQSSNYKVRSQIEYSNNHNQTNSKNIDRSISSIQIKSSPANSSRIKKR